MAVNGTPLDTFSHVRIIIAMVLGLSLARLINGLVSFIQHPGQQKPYPIHLGWVFFVLISIIHFWWYEFDLGYLEKWYFSVYVYVLLYAMIHVALAALLFPDRLSEYSGYEDYFESRRRWFYGLLILCFVLDIGDTMIKGSDYLQSLGREYAFRQAGLIAGALGALFIPGKAYQAVFVTLAIVYEMSWIYRFYYILE